MLTDLLLPISPEELKTLTLSLAACGWMLTSIRVEDRIYRLYVIMLRRF
jgi:hypothetical protein